MADPEPMRILGVTGLLSVTLNVPFNTVSWISGENWKKREREKKKGNSDRSRSIDSTQRNKTWEIGGGRKS